MEFSNMKALCCGKVKVLQQGLRDTEPCVSKTNVI